MASSDRTSFPSASCELSLVNGDHLDAENRARLSGLRCLQRAVVGHLEELGLEARNEDPRDVFVDDVELAPFVPEEDLAILGEDEDLVARRPSVAPGSPEDSHGAFQYALLLRFEAP